MEKKKKLKIFKITLLIIVVIILTVITVYLFPVMKNLSTKEGQIAFKDKVTNSGVYGLLLLFIIKSFINAICKHLSCSTRTINLSVVMRFCNFYICSF